MTVLNLYVPERISLLFCNCYKTTVSLLKKLDFWSVVTQSRAQAAVTILFYKMNTAVATLGIVSLSIRPSPPSGVTLWRRARRP